MRLRELEIAQNKHSDRLFFPVWSSNFVRLAWGGGLVAKTCEMTVCVWVLASEGAK